MRSLLPFLYISKFSEQGWEEDDSGNCCGQWKEDYPWPGNVRELENVLERLALWAEREIISEDEAKGALKRVDGGIILLLRHLTRIVTACIFIFSLIVGASPAESSPIPLTGSAEVYFSPHGGATEAIVREIDSARNEILVQAYSFTSAPIAKALLAARKRGIAIEVVLDHSQRTERYTSATFLKHAGIPVWIDHRHAIAHNKIIIIDRQTLVTGSFNFTKAAEEKNAENLLVIKGNKKLIDLYRENFQEQRVHSEIF